MKKKLWKELNKKKNSKYFIVLLLLFLVVTIAELQFKPQPLEANKVLLTKCVDGDTAHFDIDGKDEKVRFLAIDAPEIAKGGKAADPYGDDAANYTCKALQNAKVIKVEYEEEKVDKYNRRLAWVWIDGELLQVKLVEEGLAKVKYLYDDYQYTEIVQKAEKIAKQENKGVWSIK
ncbi:thermonuclease family protein [Anaerorhabdus furcosa]|uniref:Micrococcal nuclease n=1 Tax=Anaerorhabdus furcosa TaxID=118967 RepID=A0A1T4K0U0_9FIRM|nr:thermonuclease family protein [Anaerorhabdus furcosa]SJZ36033.1 micrococcal nuclease [Anaerorhabdus furcosa]